MCGVFLHGLQKRLFLTLEIKTRRVNVNNLLTENTSLALYGPFQGNENFISSIRGVRIVSLVVFDNIHE